MSETTFWVVTTDTPEVPADSSKGWGDISKGISGLHRVEVNAAEFQKEMTDLLQILGRAFKQAAQQVNAESGMQLNEVTLSLEINSKGQVSLMGVGGEAGGKGAISLKFTRA